MLDYSFLQVTWWALIGFVLIVYAATAGFDSGVTTIMPFLRNEQDRRVLLNISAPVWDGNQTWIVFAGGGLFVVWPVVYATAFSGLYAAMFCILWSLFLRPPGYDYRSKIQSHVWRRCWDIGLLISSVVPVFIFGVALGNCLLGMPFHFDPGTFRDFYTGNFFQLLSGFAVLSGVSSVLMVLMHGSAYIQRRTVGHLREMGRKLHALFTVLLFITFSIAGLLIVFDVSGYHLLSSAANPDLYPLKNQVSQGVGYWIQSYNDYPWKYYVPIIAYLSMFVSLWANYKRNAILCFWASVFTVGGVIGTAGATLFPFIMPSSTNPNQSLTVWNSTSSQYALNMMLYVGVVLLIVILVYKIFAYRTIWAKDKTITAADIEKDEHTYY